MLCCVASSAWKDGLADTTTWGEMAQRGQHLTIPEGVSPDQDFVQILDPATGTGTFLVEVIDLIHRTLVEKWQVQGHGETGVASLWNEYVPKHLLPRLHGYELLMAPYAIAHLKIGLKLYETGYHFQNDECARIFLTNALEPPSDTQMKMGFLPALAHEAQAVNKVKNDQRFTVVIGNPPYSGHSANKGKWIAHLIDDYKEGFPELRKPAQAKWLSDDYVKFIRFAQRECHRTGAEERSASSPITAIWTIPLFAECADDCWRPLTSCISSISTATPRRKNALQTGPGTRMFSTFNRALLSACV